MIPQADPWRSKRVLQKRSQQEAHAPSNVYYSTQHTNGTTYYYSSQQVIQMQQQQYINHEDSNGYSNADSTNTNGANAQWRSHQPQQTKQPEKVHSSDTKPKKQVESKKGYYHPDDRPNKNKESLYSPFLNPRDMDAGLQDGTLYEGVLKVGRSRLDCYVVTDELEHDIYIGGNRDRNRAFHGDRVVVRLKDVEESWKLKKERTERWKQKRKVQIKEEMKKYREESESDEDESDDSSYNEEDNKPKYCGEVVGIKYRAPGLAFSG
jgi:exoribonuclease R